MGWAEVFFSGLALALYCYYTHVAAASANLVCMKCFSLLPPCGPRRRPPTSQPLLWLPLLLWLIPVCSLRARLVYLRTSYLRVTRAAGTTSTDAIFIPWNVLRWLPSTSQTAGTGPVLPPSNEVDFVLDETLILLGTWLARQGWPHYVTLWMYRSVHSSQAGKLF